MSTGARLHRPDGRPVGVGEQLRHWRERRRATQLDLSNRTGVSTRHLSYVETGRSRPTPQMIMRLAEELDVPLRERNDLLLAAGFAPAYPVRGLEAPELAAVRRELGDVLRAHDPNPALLLDRWWTLLDANDAVGRMLAGCAEHLLEPPVNVCRVTLHPDGLAPRIRNLAQWHRHLLGQVRRRAEHTSDERLSQLLDELRSYPAGEGGPSEDEEHPTVAAVLPLHLVVDDEVRSFFSMVSVVETAQDVLVSELTIETFYPADDATRAWMDAARA